MTAEPRKPEAWRIDDPAIATTIELAPDPVLEGLDDDFDNVPDAIEAIVHPPRRPIRWGRLTLLALGGLVSIAAGLALDTLIRDLFSRSDWLGWTGVSLLALAVLGLTVI
ncbi:MAG: TIGR01620 family protein, partial [Alphaproteobacteria bacterium]